MNKPADNPLLQLLSHFKGKQSPEFRSDLLLSLVCLKKLAGVQWQSLLNQSTEITAILQKCRELAGDADLKLALEASDFSTLTGKEIQSLINHLSDIQSITYTDWTQLFDQISLFQEHTTAPSVNQLMAALLKPDSGNTIYDGCAGFANSLYACQQNTAELSFYGEEINSNAWRIAIRLAWLYGYKLNISNSNALSGEAFQKNGRLDTFDLAISAIPFGSAYKDNWVQQDEANRYLQEYLPRRSSSDWLFVQNALARLNDHGRAVILMMPSSLFVSGNEAHIRQNLLEKDVIEAVIALPGSLLSNTAIATSCLILNKEKPESRRDKVLFINAAENITLDAYRRQQFALSQSAINEIVDIYQQGLETEGYSRLVTIDEIVSRKYDMDIALYVSKPIHIERYLVAEIHKKLHHAEQRYQQTRQDYQQSLSQVISHISDR